MYLATLPNGDKLYVHKEGIAGLKEVGACETKETEFIQSFVKPNMVCVDIGANVGYFTVLMAKLAKHVYAFEPNKSNYRLLLENMLLNGLSNVYPYLYAVGPKFGETILYNCDINNGMHRVYPSKWCKTEGEKVIMVSLDMFKMEHPDFIKMDIEGAEYGALLSMRKILEKGSTVLMEFHTPSIREYGKEPKEVYDYMIDLGYDVRFSDDRPLSSWEALNHRATKHSGINILCTPKR